MTQRRPLAQSALVLALAAVAFAPRPAAAQEIVATTPGEKALLADFVEVSSRQSMRRDAALVELINMSDLTLDVSVGESATVLKSKERMLAGVEPGVVTVIVHAQGVSAAPLEGDLQIEGGRHYQLAFAYDVPAGPPAPRGKTSAASADATPGDIAPAGEPAAATPAPTKPRHEKVGVGRRRH